MDIGIVGVHKTEPQGGARKVLSRTIKIATAIMRVLCQASSLFALSLICFEIEAAERFEFYNGIRGLGMGGAQVAVVNDETALLVNPAGLGKLRDYFITVADPEIDMGVDTQRIVGTNLMTPFDPQRLLNKLNQFAGRRSHMRGQVFPSLVVPNFGIGVFMKYSSDGMVDTAQTNYRLDYTNDLALVMGFNLRLFDGRVKFGFNARGVNRVEIHKDLSPAATGLKVSNLSSQGFGVGSDVGLILTGPWALLPTLAAVYRDVGNTHYDLNDGLFGGVTALRPDVTLPTLDGAFSIQPILGNGVRLTISGEYRDCLTAYKGTDETTDTSRRIHAGMELNYKDAFFIRGGMNQRYYTAGVELALFNYQLQLATYGEEVGTAAAPLEDRRYVGKFSWRF